VELTRNPDLVSDLADLVSDLRGKGGVLIVPPGMYGGLYGQNLPYKFKKSYGDFQADLGSATVCTNDNLLYFILSNYTVHTELYPLPICIELFFLIPPPPYLQIFMSNLVTQSAVYTHTQAK
jgi:hypothetical protein